MKRRGIFLLVVGVFCILVGMFSLLCVRIDWRSIKSNTNLKIGGVSSHLSQFSRAKYECFSTCSCVDDRRTISAVKGSLNFAVVATSMVVAVGLANQYFLDACNKQYSGMCANIDTNTMCSEEFDPMKDDASEVEQDSPFEEKEQVGAYKCGGRCVGIQRLAQLFQEKELKPGESEIDRHKMLKKLLNQHPERQKEVECEVPFHEEVVQATWTHLAVEEFVRSEMGPYCAKLGWVGTPEELGDPEALNSVCFPDYTRVNCVKVF